jgi:hypothetical protein
MWRIGIWKFRVFVSRLELGLWEVKILKILIFFLSLFDVDRKSENYWWIYEEYDEECMKEDEEIEK